MFFGFFNINLKCDVYLELTPFNLVHLKTKSDFLAYMENTVWRKSKTAHIVPSVKNGGGSIIL